MVIVSLYVVEIAEPVFYGFLREQGDCTFHFTAQLKHIKVSPELSNQQILIKWLIAWYFWEIAPGQKWLDLIFKKIVVI